MIILVYRLKFKAKSPKWMPKFVSDSLLRQDLVSTVQESFLYYDAGVTMLAMQFGVNASVDDKVSLIWPIFI